MGGQRHASVALTPGKTQYTLYRRLSGPQDRSGQVRKIWPPPSFDPRTVQPVAIAAHLGCFGRLKNFNASQDELCCGRSGPTVSWCSPGPPLYFLRLDLSPRIPEQLISWLQSGHGSCAARSCVWPHVSSGKDVTSHARGSGGTAPLFRNLGCR